MSKIVIIDYQAGNIASVINALNHLGENAIVTSDIKEIQRAEKIIFPGVGRALPAMTTLQEKNLISAIQSIKQPFLGICLGMQLLYEFSEEDNTKGLSILPGTVNQFTSLVKIPHMGWNQVKIKQENEILKNIPDNSFFYFVHSFFCPINPIHTVGITVYGSQFSAIAKSNNFYAVQFHPEKSGEIGLQLLRNFCSL